MMKLLRRHAAIVLLVYLLAALIGSIHFGLRKNFIETRDRMPRLDEYRTETMIFSDEKAEYVVDWPYAGELHLQLHSDHDDVKVIVDTDGHETELTIGTESEWYKLPIHGPLYQYSIRSAESAELIIADNLLIFSDYSLPRFLSFLFALYGLGFAGYFILKHRLDRATLFLTLGLSLCYIAGKTAAVPHGWDEVIHMTLTWYTAGRCQNSIAWYIYSFSLWYIGYFPAAVGVVIGYALQLPTMVIYRLGDITSAICYALLCQAAVRHAPRYKLTFLAIAAMPTCVFQSGCYSYDGVVIAASLLGCSLLMEMIAKGKKLNIQHAALLLVFFCILMLPKPVYSLLLLLLFFIPESMFRSRRQQLYFRLYVLLMILWSMVALLMPGQYSNVSGGDYRIEGADSTRQLAWILLYPQIALKAFAKYTLTQLPRAFLKAPLYQLGSYTNGISKEGILLTAFVLLVCPLCTMGEDPSGHSSGLTAARRIKLLLLAVLPMLILMVTQYFVSTAPGAGEVYGMQERYALPVWLLMAAGLMLPERFRPRKDTISEWAALATAFLMTVMVLRSCMTAILPMWLYG